MVRARGGVPPGKASFPTSLPISAPLPRALFDELAARGVAHVVAERTVIAHEGQADDALLLVRHGRVRTSLTSSDGRTIVFGVLGPGHYLGEAFTDGGIRDVTATTLSPCEIVRLERRTFLELLETSRELSRHVLCTLSERKRRLIRIVQRCALLDVAERVRLLLVDMAFSDGERLVVSPRPSPQDVADHVGASRGAVGRAFRQLAAEGWLRAEKTALFLSGAPGELIPRA